MLVKYLNYKFLLLWTKYFFSKYSRYRFIYSIILNSRPKTILEIGVYKGKRSKEMIYLAKSFNEKIVYYGFDLFEDIKKTKINNNTGFRKSKYKEQNRDSKKEKKYRKVN